MLTLLALRVLENVGQPFLNEPIQHRRDIGRQRVVSAESLDIDPNAITLLPLRDIGFDRSENPEIVDRRRPQVRRRAMNVATDLGSELFQPAYLLGRRLCVAALASPCSSAFRPSDKSGHRLADLIVQLARNPALLLFLG